METLAGITLVSFPSSSFMSLRHVFSPSHQLGNEELNNISHRISDSSSAENELNGATVWQPDAGHVVETVVAASTDRIVSAIIASFKVHIWKNVNTLKLDHIDAV